MNDDIIFSWNPEKAKKIKGERGIEMEEARSVFFDPHAVIEYDQEHSGMGEDRWKIIGVSRKTRTLTVIYCELDLIHGFRRVQLITCWKATTNEKKRYNQENRPS